MKYTILILVNATGQWLTLPRAERDAFVENELRPIFKKFKTNCNIRLYDADFTHAHISDFLIVETDNLEDHAYLMGYLRESKTFAIPYFEVKELVVGVANNFRGSLAIEDITGVN
ncbi:darcynin family protein [Mucilaginibacter lappiensis]|uniref:Uncharacterized protein n=1 Tax=Mucilaginibacter lappiensis TaxID=354630 RepID=A0A841JG60_9SPHI|nr:darcynin family protein [Mucilaginibacter lappiensis]MBB6129534.1 hypothetical protein [Mucilaginibacter lappiensis]